MGQEWGRSRAQTLTNPPPPMKPQCHSRNNCFGAHPSSATTQGQHHSGLRWFREHTALYDGGKQGDRDTEGWGQGGMGMCTREGEGDRGHQEVLVRGGRGDQRMWKVRGMGQS